jgi:lipopolysaccharide export system permease protein
VSAGLTFSRADSGTKPIQPIDMSIIYRYLTLSFFRQFALVQMIVITVFTVVDFFSRIGRLARTDADFSRILLYMLLKIPQIFVLMFPVSVMLAVLIVFGVMNKNNEILALRSSGISLSYLVKPLVIIGIMMSIVLFGVAETIVPDTTTLSNRIYRLEIRKKSLLTTSGENIWIKGDRQILHIEYYNPASQSIFGVSLYDFDQQFQLARRMDAERGTFSDGQWHFYNTLEQRLDPENPEKKAYDIRFRADQPVTLNLLPDDLKSVIKKSEEMGFVELLDYIRKVENEGYDATIYKVDLHSKVAFPLICVVMCVAGMGLAVRSSLKDKLPLAIIYGIGVSFFFWVIYSFCLSLGYGGMLPPIMAAWIPIIIFSSAGGLLLLHAE